MYGSLVHSLCSAHRLSFHLGSSGTRPCVLGCADRAAAGNDRLDTISLSWLISPGREPFCSCDARPSNSDNGACLFSSAPLTLLSVLGLLCFVSRLVRLAWRQRDLFGVHFLWPRAHPAICGGPQSHRHRCNGSRSRGYIVSPFPPTLLFLVFPCKRGRSLLSCSSCSRSATFLPRYTSPVGARRVCARQGNIQVRPRFGCLTLGTKAKVNRLFAQSQFLSV